MSPNGSILSEYNLFVLVVLRDPRAYRVSSYKQELNVGSFGGPFPVFLDIRRAVLDYQSGIDRLIFIFGREVVGTLFYKLLSPAIVNSFVHVLGVDGRQLRSEAHLDEPVPRAKVTPPESVLFILSLANRVQPHLLRSTRRLLKRLLRAVSRSDSPCSRLIWEVLVRLLVASNEELLRRLPTCAHFHSPDQVLDRIRTLQ